MLNDPAQESQKIKTEGITFRFRVDVINELRKEADEKQLSCNTLISQIIKNHQEWNANASKAGMVSYPRSLLIKLMEGHSDEQITEIALYMAKKQIGDIILLLRNNYNTEAFLDVVRSWAKASGFPLTYNRAQRAHVRHTARYGRWLVIISSQVI
jgi:hypothetical protein